MKHQPLFFSFWLIVSVSVTGCQNLTPVTEPEPATERESDYQQCLQDNMAVATAWEAIEQMCREKVSEPISLLPE